MKIEQMYTGCLAHAAYYIESNGEAAVFDPLREVGPYIERAKKDNAIIKYVFETHFHADFVSGHLDLKHKTGAQIVFGPTAQPNFEALVAEDNQVFEIGNYKIRCIHTPGHTMESSCFLLIDENGAEHGIITGDTLFIGDVGRPDLAQHLVSELSEEKLAGYLYDSLRNKLMPLADHLIIYPNHGAGSACGKMMSKETTDTLGHQKQVNYALRADMDKEAFIKELLRGLTAPPGYFPQNVLMNINGYESLDTVLDRGGKALSADAFEAVVKDTDAMILDTRDPSDFAKGFIPNSVNIGLNGNFAQWVGELVPDLKQKIVLIAYPHKEIEAITRLSRVGYDFTIGYLIGGFESWIHANKAVDMVGRVSPQQFADAYHDEKPLVYDVRKRSEYNSEHIIGSINLPLNEIKRRLDEFSKATSFVILCGGGYRSMIAASILKQGGHKNFVDVIEGFSGIAKTDVDRSEYACPTSML